MSNLASTYRNQGRWVEAEQLFVQVLETHKTKIGDSHTNILSSMPNHAFTEFTGRQVNSLDLLKTCVAKQQLIIGPAHPDTVQFQQLAGMES